MAGVLPFVSGLISVAFAGLLVARLGERRRGHLAAWAFAMALFAGASFALFLGTREGWSETEFKAYWLLGAVVVVPWLALGEVALLVRARWVPAAALALIAFGSAYATVRVVRAGIDAGALTQDLPLGSEVFGRSSESLLLARLFSYAGYAVLVGGTLWSAWRMRGRPELRDRFFGTLAIAAGATVVAAGAAFAAAGNLAGFSLTLAAGIAMMFWGFLRATRVPRPAVAEVEAAEPAESE